MFLPISTLRYVISNWIYSFLLARPCKMPVGTIDTWKETILDNADTLFPWSLFKQLLPHTQHQKASQRDWDALLPHLNASALVISWCRRQPHKERSCRYGYSFTWGLLFISMVLKVLCHNLSAFTTEGKRKWLLMSGFTSIDCFIWPLTHPFPFPLDYQEAQFSDLCIIAIDSLIVCIWLN